MKIIYLHQYFNTPDMSGGTRSYEMARRLVLKGHEVHMITSYRDDNDKNGWFETNASGINVHWINVPYSNKMSFRQRILAFFKFAISSAKRASSIEADLVFATSTPLTIALPAIFVSKKQKIPMVFEVRDLWPELPIAMGALKNPFSRYAALLLEKLAYKNSMAVVALSPGMKQGVVNAGYPAEKVAVIPNSCDNELFSVSTRHGGSFRKQRIWLGDKPLVVYAGAFGLINGVSYAVELASYLQHINPTIRILLIGDGKETRDIKQLAQQVGVLNKNLFIEKKIPKKDIPAMLNAADMALGLFINKPEMQSNSSNKFFDALAAGKPIIINYGGWQKELLESSGAGLVTWGMDIEQAAQKLANALQDKKWLGRASEAASLMAKHLFSRDELADQLEKVLSLAIEEKQMNISSIAPGDYKSMIKKPTLNQTNRNSSK